ncbi:MAG TPA: metallophosphoesterase, partial [Candidatus Eisenbacteria bacterium]|nr:metallophosphoesterase [Candidatus Eisenbacteria bacterium]
FVSDLHGRAHRYQALFAAIRELVPKAVFLGGDLLPFPSRHRAAAPQVNDFVRDYLAPELESIREELRDRYPRVFLISGNDDPRAAALAFVDLEPQGLWTWAHDRAVGFQNYIVLGYAYVPPTPFLLKDWERYDMGRTVPPGCVSPEEGYRSVAEPENVSRFATIAKDLERLASGCEMERTILLAHSPPYGTHLDRAALDGKSIDYAPLDVHVGSVAIRRFIETRAPHVALSGHIHEAARLTGAWQDRLGRTLCMSAAHDGPELALVRFDLDDLSGATRELL